VEAWRAHVSKGWMIDLTVLSTCLTEQTKDMRYSAFGTMIVPGALVDAR
jgi:hypothetical protein